MLKLESLWRRDEGQCWICGGDISLPGTTAHGDPLGPTRDHIHPRAEGGSDGASNLRLAHRGCNEQRGRRGGATAFLAERVRGAVAVVLDAYSASTRDAVAEGLVAELLGALGFDPEADLADAASGDLILG